MIVTKRRPRNPTVLLGFHSPGLIGTLVVQYVGKMLKAEKIGYLDADLPPVAIISKGEVEHPMRIEHVKEGNIVLLSSEIPLPKMVDKRIGEEIVDWVRKCNGRMISIEGVLGPRKDIYKIEGGVKLKGDMKEMKEGLVLGVTGSLLLNAKEKGVPFGCIIAETQTLLPDGRASARVIEILNETLGMEVDTSPLLKETEAFERKVKKLMEKKPITDTISRIYG